MSKARLVITAIEVEDRSPAEVIAAYGVSRSWLYELLARYRAEGDAAFEPRSRRPHTSPPVTPAPAAPPPPPPGSAPPASPPPAASRCGSTAACTTSASAEPTPEPTS